MYAAVFTFLHSVAARATIVPNRLEYQSLSGEMEMETPLSVKLLISFPNSIWDRLSVIDAAPDRSRRMDVPVLFLSASLVVLVTVPAR